MKLVRTKEEYDFFINMDYIVSMKRINNIYEITTINGICYNINENSAKIILNYGKANI